MFEGIETAVPSESGNYFAGDALYRVKVLQCKGQQSRKKDDLFIVECEVLASSLAGWAGRKASWIANLSKHESALGDVRAFIATAMTTPGSAVSKTDIDEVDQKAALLVIDAKNPLAGVELKLETFTVKTREGGDFTKHRWSPLPSADWTPAKAA